MAKLIQRGLDLTVDTWADLQALASYRKVNDTRITVLDAIGDTRTVGGTVLYQYIEAFAGTPEEWMIIGGTDQEGITTVEEKLVVTDGKVTIESVPNGGILFDVIASWTENAIEFIEDVAYSLSGQDVFVSSIYNGRTLTVKYMKNSSGKLYELGTTGGAGGGVSSWNDLTDKPTTLSGFGIETEVDTKIADAVNGSIGSGVSDIDTIISSVMLPPVIDKKIIATTVEQLDLLKTGSSVRVPQLAEFDAYTDGVKLTDAAKDLLYSLGSDINTQATSVQKFKNIGTGALLTKRAFKDFYAKNIELCMSNLNQASNANYTLSYAVGSYKDVSGVLHTLTIRRKPKLVELVYDEGTSREDVLISNGITESINSFSEVNNVIRTYIDVTKYEGQISVKVSPFDMVGTIAYISGEGLTADLKSFGAKVIPFIDAGSIGFVTYQPSDMPSNVSAFRIKTLIETTPIYSSVDDSKNVYDTTTDTWTVDATGTLSGDLTIGSIVMNTVDGSLTQVTAESVTGGFTPAPVGVSEEQVNAIVNAKVDTVIAAAPEALDTLKEIADQLANDEDAVIALTNVVSTKASATSVSDLDSALTALSNSVYTSTQTDTKINDTITAMFVPEATVETVMATLDV